MATAKQKQESSYALVLSVGFIVCIPLLILSIIRYYRLKAQFPEDEYTQRVFDVGNLGRPFIAAGLLIMLTWWLSAVALSISGESAISKILIFVILACSLCILFKISQSISSTYFGVLVDPQNDRVLLPKDMANYSITDYLNLKFITELGTMEEVPLGQIKRITRQGGKQLFIHGKFGSRGMNFSRKQKRDECLSAIEEGSSAATSLEFEGA